MSSTASAIKLLTFPIQYLEVGESLARQLHLDPNELLIHCGIDTPRPFMPWQSINGRQMQLALEHFLKVCPVGVPPLVTFMDHFPLTAHGSVGLLAITSANLHEALQGALLYSPLVMPAYSMRRHDMGDEVHMVFEALHDFGEVSAFFTETVVAASLKIIPFLRRPVTDVVVHLAQDPIGDPAAYEAALGCRFVFNAQQNKLVWPARDLAIPLIAPSRASHMLMRSTLEKQAMGRADVKPITQEVRRLVQAGLRRNQVLDVAAITRDIALSPRTLCRRLSGEGTSFSRIRAEAGVEYAEMLLCETDRSIAQIALASGFSDATAFTRAFKRVTGQTPAMSRSGQSKARGPAEST